MKPRKTRSTSLRVTAPWLDRPTRERVRVLPRPGSTGTPAPWIRWARSDRVSQRMSHWLECSARKRWVSPRVSPRVAPAAARRTVTSEGWASSPGEVNSRENIIAWRRAMPSSGDSSCGTMANERDGLRNSADNIRTNRALRRDTAAPFRSTAVGLTAPSAKALENVRGLGLGCGNTRNYQVLRTRQGEPPGELVDHRSITILSRSSSGSGYRMSSFSRVSTRIVATTRLRYHFLLAGTTYQGAPSLLVRERASS